MIFSYQGSWGGGRGDFNNAMTHHSFLMLELRILVTQCYVKEGFCHMYVYSVYCDALHGSLGFY